MGKKNKKKNKHSKTKIDPALFAIMNALDMSVMFQEEKQEEWIPEEHLPIENYLHYRAKTFGR